MPVSSISTAAITSSLGYSRSLNRHHYVESIPLAKVVEPRLEELEKAYLAKDFQTCGRITMQDSNQFHATCLDTYPPIFYMNDVSR